MGVRFFKERNQIQNGAAAIQSADPNMNLVVGITKPRAPISNG